MTQKPIYDYGFELTENYNPLLHLSTCYTDFHLRRFTAETKIAAQCLCRYSSTHGYSIPPWVRVFSGGNLEHPAEVVKAAQSFVERNRNGRD